MKGNRNFVYVGASICLICSSTMLVIMAWMLIQIALYVDDFASVSIITNANVP